ncbi:sulfite exporter TauE/SafE family protein [Isoalcanivorax indicus]|uniref:sulfite exporter TauE/SafE family protein n=1 Tax=Isoalcanivorax indicus TaxID=2202653 RepID=UPI000DBAD4A9|nr:sulfite exporter TauE/SafE family protein [Isoalcanivorax indicus]
MSDSMLFASIILMAFAGSAHCVAMCGGMAMATTFSVPEHQRSGPALWHWQLLFGSGRVLTYTLLGALMGLLGAALSLPPALHGVPLLISAIIMILLALYLLGRSAGLRWVEGLGRHLWRRVQPALKHLMPVNTPLRALLLGMAWGLLPCGLVYAALALSLGAASPLTGAALMLAFGLITVPPVAAAGVIGGSLAALRGPRGRHVAAALAVLMAALLTWQAISGHDHAGHADAAPHHDHTHHH